MTAVETAQELVDKFTFSCRECDNARLSALIAVDEIIEQWEYIYVHIADGMGELNPNLKYWYEVKHELNKSE